MTRGRDWLLMLGVAVVLATGAMGLAEATAWVGKPFPGFLVLQNRVVASAGLRRWPATEGGEIYQHEVVAIDGTPLSSVESLHALVADLPPGTALEYTFARGDHVIERSIERWESNECGGFGDRESSCSPLRWRAAQAWAPASPKQPKQSMKMNRNGCQMAGQHPWFAK